uniref:Uncharacterized protein n=1 Tax=Arundo donax TaxID=35708 RepID=A0A0A9EVT3_ARUDO
MQLPPYTTTNNLQQVAVVRVSHVLFIRRQGIASFTT